MARRGIAGSQLLWLLLAVAGAVCAQESPADAAAEAAMLPLPATPLPYSDFASAAARERFMALQAEARAGHQPDPADLADQRRFYQRYNDERLAEVRRAYPADVRETTLAGVSVQVVTQRGQRKTKGGRVLINLHGGGFMWGAGSGALVEAIPVAVVSDIPVVAVDYRLAPEHPYPAAVDDVEAVYRHLLKEHRPEDIGLYGCSAASMPPPGAVATLCGTGVPFSGDSLTLGQIATGAAPMKQGDLRRLPYLRTARLDDPVAFPGEDPALLARFPPTLLMAGSRDFSVSSLTTMHRRLLGAGATADLVVFDGLWHAFLVFPDLPESKEAYALIARFFDRHLGHAPR